MAEVASAARINDEAESLFAAGVVDFVRGIGNDAKGQGAGHFDFAAVAERGEVSGIGKAEDAGGVKHAAEAGNEAAVAGAHQLGVEPHEYGGGAEAFKSEGAQNADGEHAGHGGFEALPADVADGEDHAAVGAGEDLVEVAADFLGGEIGGFDVAAGEGGQGYGDQALLELARGFQLRRCASVLEGDAALAEQKDLARSRPGRRTSTGRRNRKRSGRHGRCGMRDRQDPALRTCWPAETRAAADRLPGFRVSISTRENPASPR
jgi:hypothetical protein